MNYHAHRPSAENLLSVRVCIFAPVRTARNYGPYGSSAPITRTSGPDGKSIVMQCFFQLRAVRTGRVHRAPVRTGRKAKSFNTVYIAL